MRDNGGSMHSIVSMYAYLHVLCAYVHSIFACVICICTQHFGVHSILVRACKYQLTGRIHREPHIMARCKSVEMKPCLLQSTQHPAPSTHTQYTNTNSSESVGESRKTHGQRQRKSETRDERRR
jgi:hypothetical protein